MHKLILILFCCCGLLGAAPADSAPAYTPAEPVESTGRVRGGEDFYPGAPVLALEVSGNRIYSQEDILTRAQIRTRHGRRLDYALLQDDLRRVMSLGGFRSVDADLQPYNNGLKVVFVVQENPVIRSVDFIGNKSLDLKKIERIWLNRPQEQLNYRTLSGDIERLDRLYRRSGYELSSVEQVDISDNGILRVQILEPVINAVTVTGNVDAPPDLILREMSLQKGAVYNSNALYADRMRIFRLGYFSTVLLPEVAPAEEPGAVDLYLQVREKKKSLLSAGLGVTSQEQFAFSRLSLINLFKTGEQIQLNVQYGQEYRRKDALPKFNYRLRYYYPWFLFRDMSWGISKYLGVGYETLRNPQSGVDSLLPIRRDGFATDLNMPLPFGPQYQLLFEYKDEFVQEDVQLSPAIHYLKRSLSAVYTYNALHYLGDTGIVADGDIFQLRLEKGGRADLLGEILFDLGGVSFHRTEVQYSRFMPLAENNHIIGLNYRSGVYVSAREKNILEGEEYSMGGSATVRGYADTEPFAVGPKMILLNAEYRYIFNEHWQGVLFYDWGHAFTSPEVSVKEFKSGYGLGLRVTTPIGPLRFDLGRGELYWIFHFGLGYTF
ncbi:MAG: BamA/TamA family outer membrane protein [Candidatus Margulisbacteria bacterium]|jgi:outer membrane protein insertion porin family|nr:BamA/TamA family outer membrane protein [Candidatus Margulisiibacteriota bacterium]